MPDTDYLRRLDDHLADHLASAANRIDLGFRSFQPAQQSKRFSCRVHGYMMARRDQPILWFLLNLPCEIS